MKSIRLAATAICLTLSPHISIAGPAWEPIVPFGVIKGMVRDSAGQPVPYANVMVLETTCGAMSGQDGLFSIYFVPPATHRVRAMVMGFHTVWVDSVVVRMGHETEIVIELKGKQSVGWIEGKRAP